MSRQVLTLVLLTCVPALSVAIEFVEGSPAKLSGVDCRSTTPPEVFVRWTAPTAAGKERVFVSTSDSCPTDVTADREIVLIATRTVNPNDATSAGRAVDAAELFALAGAEECGGDEGVEKKLYFCVVFSEMALGTDAKESIAIDLDSKAPATPTDVTASPLSNGLLIDWKMPTELKGAARYNIYVTPPSGIAIVKTFEGAGLRQGRVGELENGVEYTVEVSAVDDAGSRASAGNESPRSAQTTGTPVASLDFWAQYQEAGGSETGGCGSVPGAGLAALGALALLLRRRKGTFVLVLALVVHSAPAFAQWTDTPAEVFSPSPRYGSFELRTGPYLPNVDSEPGLTGAPFASTFKSKSAMLWRAEVDVDLLDVFGRLGVGGSVGWAGFSGKARLADGTEANDTTSFSVVPLTLLVYYRADFVNTLWGIPLVPYVKAGYGFVNWSTKLEGKQSVAPGPDGSERRGGGWARGLELSAGLQLVLDWIEPEQVAELDQSFGINSTSIFFDATWTKWKGHALLLEDTVFSGGLLLAF